MYLCRSIPPAEVEVKRKWLSLSLYQLLLVAYLQVIYCYIGTAISNGVCIPLNMYMSIPTHSLSGVNRDCSGIIRSRSKKA